MEIRELKEAYRIPTAWRDLALPDEPGNSCRSPFPGEHKHGDASPSFSVFDDGRHAKDFATGEHFDVIDFIRKARNCDVAEAIRFIQDRLRIPRSECNPSAAKTTGSKIPPLRPGSETELRELAEQRGFNPEALRLAHRLGFLFFTNLWGHGTWCVTDARRSLFEFRRVNGQKWPAFGRLSERKCHCMGTGKRWPVGVMESESFEKIVVVEGAPDFLAVFHFLIVEGKENSVAPIGILGASNHSLAPEALALFKGKLICMYPHVDEAGRRAVQVWARQFKDAGAARVTAFDLSGLKLTDGCRGKDLADVCRISPDCLETERKFVGILP